MPLIIAGGQRIQSKNKMKLAYIHPKLVEI